MAKQSLKEKYGIDNIKKTNDEENKPFWIIDETYGVSADNYGYSLVERKEMVREIKDEKGEGVGAESYYSWSFCKSANSFEDALLAYTRVTERKLMSKLVKCKDFRELVSIRLQIQKTINNSFKINGVNSELLDACNTIQGHEDLKIKLSEVNKLADEATKSFNELIESIKEKRKIIVQEMPKEKKHRIKEEE